MEANDFLCYGKLSLDVTRYSLVQLVADNGAGKTNILSIITEALYGKNPRGYAKGELFNRNTNATKYSISVTFSKDGSVYVATTNRTKTVAKVTLTKDGVDITSHTSKGTFSDIEAIIGLDYELFLQYVYQSSKYSTEFLTATPATRKQFLSKMLDLDTISDDIEKVSTHVKALQAKLSKLSVDKKVALATLPAPSHNDIIDVEKLHAQAQELLEVQEHEVEAALAYRLYEAKENELKNEVKNRSKNLQSLVKPVMPKPKAKLPYVDVDEALLSDSQISSAVLKKAIAELKSKVLTLNSRLATLKASKPSSSCHVCGSELHNNDAIALHDKQIADTAAELASCNEKITAHSTELANLEATLKRIQLDQAANAAAAAVAAFNASIAAKHETAMEIYNSKLQTLTQELQAAQTALDNLEIPLNPPKDSDTGKLLSELNKSIIEAKHHNAAVLKHIEVSAKIKVIEDEITHTDKELAISQILLDGLKQLLAKTIDNGLTSLEINTNKFLRKFGSNTTISFLQEDSKVNVKVNVGSDVVNYYTLSTGQAARVSIATLLAMRELLVDSVNLLILDEVVGTLDTEGKESLIEILTDIQGMNIFLVSHDWTHPLLEKIEVKTSPSGSFISYG